MNVTHGFRGMGAVALFLLTLVSTAIANYSGGSGTAADPYQIATAADLIALGETPADYDKHFVMVADIDLEPNLPGRKIFDKAVIAPAKWVCVRFGGCSLSGIPFVGVFDGNGHGVRHLTVAVKDGGFGGLFGGLGSGADVKNLGVVDVNITGFGVGVGGLVGWNCGNVTNCHSSGVVTGKGNSVGGLVGENDSGTVTQCYSTGAVSGDGNVGGLVGANGRLWGGPYEGYWGSVTQCYSTGAVSGNGRVGGLVGSNNTYARVSQCYSTGTVSGIESVGGLVGSNNTYAHVSQCYSTGTVSGIESVGGLVGEDYDSGAVIQCYSTGAVIGNDQAGGLVGSHYSGEVTACFWDTQTSGRFRSAGGKGLTTVHMQDVRTYLDAGWDLVDEVENGTSQVWQMPQGGGYPVLGVFNGYGPAQLEGQGSLQDPYRITDALELGAMVHYSCHAHYRLDASIDLSGIRWSTAVIPWFAGTFDGNGHTISHLTIRGSDYLGLFGRLVHGAEVGDLGAVDVNIAGSGGHVGGLVGENDSGTVTQCYCEGRVDGEGFAGGLVGGNRGTVTQCYSTASVSGTWSVGGLVGYNEYYGTVAQCYSTGEISGIGQGSLSVGGLVGGNDGGTVTQCYSSGVVSSAGYHFGGLVGSNNEGTVTGSFWDVQTSAQNKSAGGTGKTTAEMQTAKTSLDAGWDFVGETANGTDDIWWIREGKDYPRLWWEAAKK